MEQLKVLSTPQLEILEAIWSADSPITVQEIQEKLSKNLSNIHRRVKELEGDGFLRVSGVNNAQGYAREFVASVSAEAYYAFLLRNLFKGKSKTKALSSFISHYVQDEEIGEQDLEEIKKTIDSLIDLKS